MGRVGSTSISEAIWRSGLGCFDIHSVDEKRLRERTATGKAPDHVWHAMGLRRRLLENTDQFLIITSMRDPISRNISAVMQNIRYALPKGIALDSEEARRVVLGKIRRYDHYKPLRWVHREMGALGIDLYAHPFDPAEKYAVYDDRTKVVVFRVDAPDEIKTRVLSECLGRQIEVKRENGAEDKPHKELYRYAMGFRFPDDFVNRMYDHRYVRHFWTEEERAAFKQHWSISTNPDAPLLRVARKSKRAKTSEAESAV